MHIHINNFDVIQKKSKMSHLLVALPPDQSQPITSSIRCEARINKTEKNVKLKN